MSVNLSTVGVSAYTTGTVTSTGIGSGLDINTIVTSLVNAEIDPRKKLLTSEQTQDQTTLSTLGTLTSALASLQSATDSLTTGHALTSLTATSSSTASLTASTSNQAVSGSYQVEVTQLAKANTIASGLYASGDAVVGSGSYVIAAGGGSFTVTLGSGSDTLANLRDAINSSDDNSGVSASIVYAEDGARLLLTAQRSGTANAVSVTSASVSFSTVTAAADAKLTVAGFDIVSASNVVSGAIDGVTLNLTQLTTSAVTVTVAANPAAAATAVQTFVTAYNLVRSQLVADTAYAPPSSATAGSAGPLQGDSAILSLMQRLVSIIGGSAGAGGAVSTLGDLGISSDATGALSIDSVRLTSALQQDGAGVQSLFSGTSGLGTRLNDLLSSYIGPGGTMGTKTTLLQDQLTTIGGKLDALTGRSAQLAAQYSKQFNAMDSIVAGYKNTSSLLTQLYAPREQDGY